jgi:hypothetical protein
MSVNDEHDDDQGADSKPGMMRRQLIALLNQPAGDDGKSRLQKILDALIGKAQEGDLAATKEIFDRCDGKAQVMTAADDGDREVTFKWLDSPLPSDTSPDRSLPASTPAPGDSPAS